MATILLSRSDEPQFHINRQILKAFPNSVSKYWEIIADNLSNAGWSWGCVSAIDCNGLTICIADGHRGDGKRFIVRGDEKLTAFVELERQVLNRHVLSRLDS